MKDCIEIWQKATIRDALPDEYKEKMRQEQAKASHARYETGSEQTSEFAPFDETVIAKKLQKDMYLFSILSENNSFRLKLLKIKRLYA